MKKSNIRYVFSLLLSIALLFSITVCAFAAGSRQAPQAPTEEIQWVLDPGVSREELARQDSRHVYLYPSEDGGYIEVEEVADPGGDPALLATGSREEWLTPQKLDETTCLYQSEDGSLSVTVSLAEEAGPSQIPLDSTRYAFNWLFPAQGYTHGTVDLDITNGDRRLHFTGTLYYSTFLGYYQPCSDTYFWLEIPLSPGTYTDVYFSLAGSHPVNFALKNNSDRVSRCFGSYWLTLDQ